MRPLFRRAQGVAVAVLLGVGLPACVLHPPTIQAPVLRTTVPVVASAFTAPGQWPASAWWERYGDPVLDQLVAQALQGAPSLSAADARFSSARQLVRISGAAQGIQVEANGTAQHQRISDNGLLPPQLLGFNWYSQTDLGVSANYTFDWWGKQRASIEAAVDESRAAQADRKAAELVLVAAVADSYFGWLGDQQRLGLVQARLALMERQARISAQRIAAQLDSGDSVRAVAQDIAATRERVAVLEGSARLRVVALAALLGRGAETLPPMVPRPLPVVQAALPESVRLDLIARRPDVAASRWRVESAQQSLVAVRGEYYPDVSLRALVGLSSIEIGSLLKPGSAVPSIGAAIHLPLFDSGLRDARFGARQAQVAAAVATYDEAVFAAAREVATAASTALSLSAQHQQRELHRLEAQALLDSAGARVRAGTADARAQLSASLLLNTDQDGLAQLNLAALSADVALQRALGGGYVARETTP